MSGKRQPTQVPDYTGQSLQTSTMTACVPYAGGLVRVTPNLIYYTDYEVHSHSSKGGGKGGGKTKSYTYSATILLALCEGPISTILKTWVNQGYFNGFTDAGFILFLGTIPQAAWTYLASAHANDAFGYQGIAYTAAKNYDLGGTPTVPQHSYEVAAPNYNTGYTGAGDADCALEVQRFLTNDEYGALFPSAFLDTTSYDGGSLLSGPNATTTGDSAYQTYCRAMGWGISPFINNQEVASDVVARWLQITNTAPVWTGYSLKFIPWGDAAVTGNGVTYLPPTGSVFDFTDSDYIQEGDSDPILSSISDWYDAANALAIEVSDRDNGYNSVPIDNIDQSQNQLIGRRYGSTIQAREICYLPMAFEVVSLLEQRMVYVRERYVFKVGPEYSELEPMDCGTITEVILGLNSYPVRIRDMEEQDDGSFELTCEEFPGTLGQPVAQTTQGGSRSYNNNQVDPGPTNDPIIFEPNILASQRLNNGSSVPILCILASGGAGGVNNQNWGGAIVNVSTDGGASYGEIGTITITGRQGYLTANFASYGGANPDSVHTLSVNLAESAGTLESASSTDAANGVTLCIVQDGVGSTSFELLSLDTVTLTGTNTYNLTNNYRGQYGTTAGAHTTGALFGRLDNGLFVFPMPSDFIGVHLKLKLQSFNSFGNQLQDITTCTVYDYTPIGTGYGGGAGGVPSTPAAPTATAVSSGAQLVWAANPATDNVDHYEVWRAPGLGASFGAASMLPAAPTSNAYLDASAAATNYTYFIKAVNVVGASLPSAGGNFTGTTAGGLWGFSFEKDLASVVVGNTIADWESDVSWTVLTSVGAMIGCSAFLSDDGTLPSVNTDFDLHVNGVSVGTIRLTSGSHTCTLIMASNTAVPGNQKVQIYPPSSLNGATGRLAVTIKGPRS